MHGDHGIPKTPRYVLWGEGTTDEMCLGILQVTRGVAVASYGRAPRLLEVLADLASRRSV